MVNREWGIGKGDLEMELEGEKVIKQLMIE
jgi:hypothetical protein